MLLVGGVSLAEAPTFKKAPGGAPANVAIGISRLRGSSAFLGKLEEMKSSHALAGASTKETTDSESPSKDGL